MACWRGACLGLALFLGLPGASLSAPPAPAEPCADYAAEVKAAVNAVSEQKLKDHAMYLAGDGLEGREAGSVGGAKAAEYLVAHHRRIGMADPVGDGTYTQPFSLGSGSTRGPIEQVNGCVVGKKKGDPQSLSLLYQKDFLPFRCSGEGDVAADAVFAGFGLGAPEHGYDDYAGLDVTGKVVVVLPGGPKGKEGPFAAEPAAAHATVRRKAETAKGKGAAALLVLGDPANDPSRPLVEGDASWPPPDGEAAVGLPVALVSQLGGDALFKLARKKRAALLAAIEKELRPQSCALPGVWLEVAVHREGRLTGIGSNICALWKATAPDAVDEYVVIGAHRDHVGYGKFGSKGKPGEIHNGADDNASGTSGLLELARVVAEEKLALRRHLLLLHFDGEEKGLLGSKHYVSAPLVPIEKTVAMLNMDMIGRNAVSQMMCGPEEPERNPAIQKILLKISARFGVALPGDGMKQFMHRSDQWAFMQKGIPAIFLFGGDHSDYHTQNDDPEKLSYRKMANITKLILLFAVEVAALEQRP